MSDIRRDNSRDLEPRVRAGGLLEPGRPVVVLLSGGRDSVCLLDVAVRISGDVSAVHLNYGLRPTADQDEALCRALCARLDVDLEVAKPRHERGNVQAWAREQRYALAARRGVDVATGHTASDQVETVLYRLAASPGRRALLGMRPREGRLIRPLLACTRAQTAEHCRARGLAFAEDETNADPRYARSRIRHGLLPALQAVHPAAEANVLRTLATLRDEAAVLDQAVEEALAHAQSRIAALAALPPALARLALQRLADQAHPRAPAIGPRAAEILALAPEGSRQLDLGGGLKAVVEYGVLRFERQRHEPAPEPTTLAVPGSATFGAGRITCEAGSRLPLGDGTLDAARLATPLRVRPWRPGDRMRPLGLGGTRALQDLFIDRKIPRARRATLPVVESDGEIAWIPGVATGERFRVTTATKRRARLEWRPYA